MEYSILSALALALACRRHPNVQRPSFYKYKTRMWFDTHIGKGNPVRFRSSHTLGFPPKSKHLVVCPEATILWKVAGKDSRSADAIESAVMEPYTSMSVDEHSSSECSVA